MRNSGRKWRPAVHVWWQEALEDSVSFTGEKERKAQVADYQGIDTGSFEAVGVAYTGSPAPNVPTITTTTTTPIRTKLKVIFGTHTHTHCIHPTPPTSLCH